MEDQCGNPLGKREACRPVVLRKHAGGSSGEQAESWDPTAPLLTSGKETTAKCQAQRSRNLVGVGVRRVTDH